MGEAFSIFLLSLPAMFNPTLPAAVTIMMLLPEPRKLVTGYLLGAYLTSIGLGMAIVFSFHQSSGEIAKLGWPSATTALAVIVFCLIQQLLLELPLAGFWLARTGPKGPSSASAAGSRKTPPAPPATSP